MRCNLEGGRGRRRRAAEGGDWLVEEQSIRELEVTVGHIGGVKVGEPRPELPAEIERRRSWQHATRAPQVLKQVASGGEIESEAHVPADQKGAVQRDHVRMGAGGVEHVAEQGRLACCAARGLAGRP